MGLRRRGVLWMATGMLLSMGCGSNTQAQQPTANHPMAFDVVSIREVKEQSEELVMNSRFIGDTFLAKNASLLELIALAYETRSDLVFNLPGWARTMKWDVEAKISDQLRIERQQEKRHHVST